MADTGEAVGFSFGDRFEREFTKLRDNVIKPVILVMGATGAGKSSLVNMVFGSEVAEVSAGKPVTSGVICYENDLVKIFDSEGYESGAANQQRFVENVVKFIDKDCAELGDRVNMVWYCISQANHRVLDIDVSTVNAVAALNVPIAIVLTQADSVSAQDSEKMLAVVKSACPGVATFEVSNDPEVGLSVEPLSEWSYSKLDAGLRMAFVAATKGQLKLKEREALAAVATFVASATVIAATPIPFSDAPLLMANQAAMVARVAYIWDMPGVKGFALGSVMSQLVSNVGRTIAGNLVKLIPGGGTLVGGVINAGVAASMTAAVGYAVSEVCSRINTDQLNGIDRNLADYFDGDMLETLIRGYMQKGRSA